MTTLNTEQAQFCAGIFNDYFGQFIELIKYMRDQKLVQIKVFQRITGMGLEDDMFDDFSMSPEDMDLQVVNA